MPKNTTRLKTSAGELDLLVDFNVAADFEDETGVSPYDTESNWFRRPKLVRKMVYLAAKRQHPDLTEDEVGALLTSKDFPKIIEVLAIAVFGKDTTSKAEEDLKAERKAAKEAPDPAAPEGNAAAE